MKIKSRKKDNKFPEPVLQADFSGNENSKRPMDCQFEFRNFQELDRNR
jgi:hypothetical protein